MYALIDIRGKQYKAEKGIELKIDRIPQEAGEKVEFNSVLLVGGGDDVKIGAPYVDGVSVQATVKDHGRDKKVVVVRYKKRKGYKKTRGHRQPYSVVKIEDIVGIS
ncbi:MAG: 50S ribosomal protein L21 [Spirochaetales bacterium]|nr:50S ribosomal protein L21 [Spirochaetales bacterium]